MSKHLVAEALSALKNQNFTSARNCMEAFGRTQPLELQHFLIRGLAELALKEWSAAALTFAAAIKRYPSDAQLWFNLGTAQENLKQIENAAVSYERCLALNPDQAEACGNLSNIYCRLARFAEAEKFARRALTLGAPQAQALNSLGLALNRHYQFAEAEAAFMESLRLEPDNPLVLTNLANLAIDRLDFESAWPWFAKARVAGGDAPVIRHYEGMARLLAGDYQAGWPLYEARLDVPGSLRVQPSCPLYRGEPLMGKKILLIAEQGLGDVIQFCRYSPLLAKSGAAIISIAPQSLQTLLAANLPGRVLNEHDTLPNADFYVPLLSLPLALGLPRPEAAPSAPYLHVPGRAEAPQLPKATKRKIGLVWNGSPINARDFERSIPLTTFAPLWQKIPAQFYAPWTGAGLEQIGDAPITRLDHLIHDFTDAANLLTQLDCLITVDTAAAHLAGALGVKTHLLLPYCPDWRWGAKGETTPWYPSLTLWRQTKPGDWASVIARLAALLASA